MNNQLHGALGAAILCAALAAPAHAGQIIVNGGFETGNFAGWHANVQSGSNGNLFVVPNGSTAPISGELMQSNPGGGNFVALSSQGGPGSYSLTQSFTLPFATDVMVSYDFVANSYAAFASTDPNRDYTVSPNQNAEVDILTGGANPFTVVPSDIITTLYGPGIDSGANPNPWTHYSFDLGVMAAGTYQIRFAETDNQLFFNMGVDNVVVDAAGVTVPEPVTIALFGAGLAGIGSLRRRRARR
jgi:PEP-CTERM motif